MHVAGPGTLRWSREAPDPHWHAPALAGWVTGYLDWPARGDGDAGVPDEVAAALAQALADAAWVVFLVRPAIGRRRVQGSPGSRTVAVPADWRQWFRGVESRWALLCSRDPSVVATLFDQDGFDWTQRGQIVLLYPADTRVEALDATVMRPLLAEDPPTSVPRGCIGLMRPGTDGDFAELSTPDTPPGRALMGALLARCGCA